jgi:Zn-dependent peptidase ImmA (M78 family)
MLLDSEKIQEIESLSRDILSSIYSDSENIVPPINIERILENNDVKLRIGDFSDPEVSGYYERSTQSISVSQDDPYPRQIFTIAHELGHHFLHDTKKDVFHRKDAINIASEERQEETEANWFAASLLMPAFLVKRTWMLKQSIKYIAEFFEVSNITAFYRLKNLGLLAAQEEQNQIKVLKKFGFMKYKSVLSN